MWANIFDSQRESESEEREKEIWTCIEKDIRKKNLFSDNNSMAFIIFFSLLFEAHWSLWMIKRQTNTWWIDCFISNIPGICWHFVCVSIPVFRRIINQLNCLWYWNVCIQRTYVCNKLRLSKSFINKQYAVRDGSSRGLRIMHFQYSISFDFTSLCLFLILLYPNNIHSFLLRTVSCSSPGLVVLNGLAWVKCHQNE